MNGMSGRRVKEMARRAVAVVVLAGILVAAFVVAIRPRVLLWGATRTELELALPGDSLVAAPSLDATRAITIHGTPRQIWPWLVQMGFGRAGFYGYDLIEGIGSRSGMRSAERIVPSLQTLRVGDTVGISLAAHVVVAAMRRDAYILWSGGGTPASGSFLWMLLPIDRDHTRLISRIHLRYRAAWPDAVLDAVTEVGDHVAVPRILQGVRARVEGRRDSLAEQIAIMATWTITLGALVAAIVVMFRRDRWGRLWWAALLAGSGVLYTLYAGDGVDSKALATIIVLIVVVRAARAPLAQPVARINRSGRAKKITREAADSLSQLPRQCRGQQPVGGKP
jgi:hypothetical protein